MKHRNGTQKQHDLARDLKELSRVKGSGASNLKRLTKRKAAKHARKTAKQQLSQMR